MNDLYKYLKDIPTMNPNVAVSIAAKDDGVDTSDATVTADDILKDKIAYGKDGKVVGTIPSWGPATITPSDSINRIAAGQYIAGEITIPGSPNLKPENIKAGVEIFGVMGTYTGA